MPYGRPDKEHNKLLEHYQTYGEQIKCEACGITHSAWLGHKEKGKVFCGFCQTIRSDQ